MAQQQQQSVHPWRSLVPAALEPAMFSWLSSTSLVPPSRQQCFPDGAASASHSVLIAPFFSFLMGFHKATNIHFKMNY